jgi:hypothetical protein
MAKRSKYATARRRLRAICWVTVALAVIHAGSGTTAPGGATLGLVLAGLLATALRLTKGHRRAARKR